MARETQGARRVTRRTALATGAALCLKIVAAPRAMAGVERPGDRRRTMQQGTCRILAFTKTTQYRHDSIPEAVAALQALGAEHGFGVDRAEDAAAFTDQLLTPYRAVVFLLTTGEVLDAEQQAAFERYIRAGGGYVGIHSACDTEYDWPWYGRLVGAYFSRHPEIQTATVWVEDRTHRSTAGLPERWERTDEWYDFRANPRGQVNVLARLDEATYTGGGMGDDHPIAWWHDFEGGRAWYTAGGHTAESYREPLFLQHLLGGIQYAVGDR
jgi:cytochrome c